MGGPPGVRRVDGCGVCSRRRICDADALGRTKARIRLGVTPAGVDGAVSYPTIRLAC